MTVDGEAMASKKQQDVVKIVVPIDKQTETTGSNQATNLSTLVEDNESWNSLNMILIRNLLMLVSIHFSKIEFPLVFNAQFLEYRRNSATGTTPCSPEIDDNGFVRFEYLCLEILVSHIDEVFLRVH